MVRNHLVLTLAAAVLSLAPAAAAAPCEHDVSWMGDPLDYGCDACIDTVCESDSYCCEAAWDAQCVAEATAWCGASCEHETSWTGDPLEPGCDVCVDTVCSADSYCCEVAWDAQCVAEASAWCVDTSFPTHGWYAWCDGALHVNGTVMLPSEAWTPSLRRLGANTAVLSLEMDVEPRPGIWPEGSTAVSLVYSEPSCGSRTHVAVRTSAYEQVWVPIDR